MKRFEYRVVEHRVEPKHPWTLGELPVELLNKEGADGWELCGFSKESTTKQIGVVEYETSRVYVIVFKRELPDDSRKDPVKDREILSRMSQGFKKEDPNAV